MNASSAEYLKSILRFFPDYPKPGIRFVDVMPILYDRIAFQHTVQQLADKAWQFQAEAVAVIESRGFLFGAPVAFSLGVPLIPVRKSGKLPGELNSLSYKLEYGEATLELQKSADLMGKRVVILDDLLATGGTAKAALSLLQLAGANVVGALFVVEIAELDGFRECTIPKNALISL